MKHKKSKTKNSKNFKSIVILCSIFLIITNIFIFSFISYKSYKTQMQTDMSMLSTVSLQANSSIETYRNKIEGCAKNFFSQKKLTEYDPTITENPSYQRVDTESEIALHLESLGFMDEFASFGVVYRDNSTIGTIDEKELNTYNDENGTFENAEKILGSGNQKWYASSDPNNSKIFFLKRANTNAVFVASMYKINLDNIFDNSLIDKDITIVITDHNFNSIYTTNENHNITSKELADFDFQGERNVVSNNKYIAANNPCFDDWNTIAIISLQDQLNASKNIIVISFTTLIVSLILFWCIAVIFNMDKFKETPLPVPDAIDTVTGLYNAETAENLIEDKIERCSTGSTLMLALIKLKNYQIIKENYGVDGTTDAILKTKKAIEDFYNEDTIIGKIGEDEFIVFADFTQYDLFAVHSNIKNSLSQLETALKNISLDNNRGQVKYAVGASTYPDDSSDYDELYECARTALEECKANERGHYVLYQQKKK